MTKNDKILANLRCEGGKFSGEDKGSAMALMASNGDNLAWSFLFGEQESSGWYSKSWYPESDSHEEEKASPSGAYWRV